MKNTLILSLVFCLTGPGAFAQLSLTVEIVGLRSNKGQVLLELSDENQRPKTKYF
jgi:uncharacterized protein (DUF2141 family)